MLIGELIQRVQSVYSHGVQSDDTRLSNRHIYNALLTARSHILHEEEEKEEQKSLIMGVPYNEWKVQTLPCVELIQTTINECPCLPPVGCSILKSKEKIPKTFFNKDRVHLISVTSIDGGVQYSETTWKAKKYKKGNRYTSHSPDYFLRNEHLYVTWSKGPKVVSVSGIFIDPIEVEEFKSFCDKETGKELRNECISPLDVEFNIEDRYIERLIMLVMTETLNRFMSTEQDVTNNTLEDKKHVPYQRNV